MQDARSAAQPWRWSFEGAERPWPLLPPWGFEGNLEPAQLTACRDFAAALRAEAGAELPTAAALMVPRRLGCCLLMRTGNR